jgi:hypothetical protein
VIRTFGLSGSTSLTSQSGIICLPNEIATSMIHLQLNNRHDALCVLRQNAVVAAAVRVAQTRTNSTTSATRRAHRNGLQPTVCQVCHIRKALCKAALVRCNAAALPPGKCVSARVAALRRLLQCSAWRVRVTRAMLMSSQRLYDLDALQCVRISMQNGCYTLPCGMALGAGR